MGGRVANKQSATKQQELKFKVGGLVGECKESTKHEKDEMKMEKKGKKK